MSCLSVIGQTFCNFINIFMVKWYIHMLHIYIYKKRYLCAVGILNTKHFGFARGWAHTSTNTNQFPFIESKLIQNQIKHLNPLDSEVGSWSRALLFCISITDSTLKAHSCSVLHRNTETNGALCLYSLTFFRAYIYGPVEQYLW